MSFAARSILRTTVLLALLLAVLTGLGVAAEAQTVMLDTFQNDSPGQPPNAPEVGSGSVFAGTNTVIDEAGDHWLRTRAVGGTGGGYTWRPSGSPLGILRVSYDFEIESGAMLGAANAVANTLAFDGGAAVHELSLTWGDDLRWRVAGQTGTFGGFELDRTYRVEWTVDTTTDRYNLLVGGQVLVFGGAAGANLGAFESLRIASNLTTTADWRTDDVKAWLEGHLFGDAFETGDTSLWANGTSAPGGDECSSPKLLLEGVEQWGDLADNTGSSGDDSSCGASDGVDEWYEVAAGCDGTMVVTTCHPGTEFDTVLSGHDGCNQLSELVCNDDGALPSCDLGGALRKSVIAFPARMGDTYRVRVSAYQDTFPDPSATAFQISATCAVE